MAKGLIFISYRREDEGSATRFLKADLDRYFGRDQVFMDVDDIRSGDKWQLLIKDKLLNATVFICVIGKNWLSLHDEYYRRRIDNEDDWVRKEIETSVSRDVKIIPLLLGADLPKKEALPKSIKTLVNNQALSLTALHWRVDLKKLFDVLVDSGIQKVKDNIVPYPQFTLEEKRTIRFPLALNDPELKKELTRLQDWRIVDYPFHEPTPDSGRVIEKTFEFNSFDDVIAFMSGTSKYITEKNHHPEWNNIYKILRVRLSSWDIEHKISYLDIELAEYLDAEFEKYRERPI